MDYKKKNARGHNQICSKQAESPKPIWGDMSGGLCHIIAISFAFRGVGGSETVRTERLQGEIESKKQKLSSTPSND